MRTEVVAQMLEDVRPWLNSATKAFIEVLAVVFFSFFPAILSASKTATISTESKPIFWPALASTISNGQLLVFTSAILGSIIFLSLPIWQPSRFIILRSILILVVFLLVVFVTFIGGFDPSFQNSNKNLVSISIFTYIFAVVTYFVFLVINEPPETDLGASMRAESDALTLNYENNVQE